MGKKESEAQVVYNIIDSVKGGCGKTSFSLMLALAIQRQYQEENKKTQEIINETAVHACLMDMDIQGTSLEYLLLGLDGRDERKTHYLNEIISQSGGENKSYVRPIKWGMKNSGNEIAEETLQLDAVFSSPNQNDKDRYKAVSSQNYSPEVMYSTFRAGLTHFLKEDLKAQRPYNYDHIIFDMPPNSDGYSDAVYDCLFHNKYKVTSKKSRRNLFIMQTLDIGHRFAAREYFKKLMSSNDKSCNADGIFFVYSNISLNSQKSIENIKHAVIETKVSIEKMEGLNDSIKDRIYFVGVRFIEEYYELCVKQNAIVNTPVSNEIAFPILFLEKYRNNVGQGTSYREYTRELIDLMEGK